MSVGIERTSASKKVSVRCRLTAECETWLGSRGAKNRRVVSSDQSPTGRNTKRGSSAAVAATKAMARGVGSKAKIVHPKRSMTPRSKVMSSPTPPQ